MKTKKFIKEKIFQSKNRTFCSIWRFGHICVYFINLNFVLIYFCLLMNKEQKIMQKKKALNVDIFEKFMLQVIYTLGRVKVTEEQFEI
jgi:hypothetical protein